MPEFTKSQLLAMKFDRFDALAASLKKRADEREGAADELARDVANPQGEGEWTGVAGRAAQDSSHTIGLSMKKQSATEEGAGGPLRETGSSMQSHKDAVAGTMRRIEGDDDMRIFVTYQDGVAPGSYHPEVPSKIYNCGNPVVSEDFAVDLKPEAKQFVDYHGLWGAVIPTLQEDKNGLDMRLKEFEDAAAKHAQAITQATDFDQIAKDDKNPLVGETPAQAKEDVDAYMNGTATDAQRKRVEAAASALKPGETPTRERATLLQALSDGMRGKSVSDLSAIQDKNGDHALSNAVELVTDPKLETVGVLDKDGKPWHGGPDNLPQSIRDLDKQPVSETKQVGSPKAPNTEIHYPNIEQCRQLAQFVNKADDATKRGTEVDRVLMHKSEQILARTEHRNDDAISTAREIPNPDAALQEMLGAAGKDHEIDHEFLAGKDGRSPNQAFISDLTKHQWPDHGAAAAGLLSWTEDAANRGSPQEQQLAAETVHAVAGYIGDHKDDYMHIHKGLIGGGDTFGSLNPELARALAHGLDPQIGAMFGDPQASSHDYFKPLDNDRVFSHTRDLLSVLDTDQEAGKTINAAAMREQLLLENRYAQALHDDPSQAKMEDLTRAAKIQGVEDKALQAAQGVDAANQYQIKSEAFDMAKSSVSAMLKVSGGGTGTGLFLDLESTALKGAIVGNAPGLPPLPGNPQDRMVYEVMTSAIGPNPSPQDIRALQQMGALDPSGHPVPYEQYLNGRDPETVNGDLMTYLKDRYGQSAYNAADQYWKEYLQAIGVVTNN